MTTFDQTDFRAAARSDFMTFAHAGFHELNPQTSFSDNWHLHLIASKLEAIARGRCRRLIVALPPRSLKSHLVSIAFIAWYLGHHPARQVVAASYGQDLASKHAHDCRQLMESALYRSIFGTRIGTRRAVDDFSTTDGGGRMATSVGGVLTGRGGDLLVIDDALKPDDALSETRRKAANEWYDNTLLTRLNNKTTGAIVIVMQRLHQDDLIGHVRQQGEWEAIDLPAIAEEDEHHVFQCAYGVHKHRRKKGEALHPERESLAVLAEIRSTIGDYNFLSQYQQTPVPKGGAMIKHDWLRYYDPENRPKRFSVTIQSWDTANKTSELNDYSVCTTWGAWNGNYYLLDLFRKRLNYPDLRKAVGTERAKYGFPTIVIEDKASGTQLIQELQASGIVGVVGIEPPPGVDKVMRVHAKTVLFENGKVFLPDKAPWLDEYVRELTGFPGVKFDDQVDSTTQALDYLAGGQSVVEIFMRSVGVRIK